MSTLEVRIKDLATRIATECKAIRTLTNGNAADLTALSTTAKTSLVAAINELKSSISSMNNVAINDGATGTGTTWSSTQINSAITTAINGLMDGAPTALNTLKELADAINDDAAFASTITAALGYRVRFDAAQTLTAAQITQVCANLGIGEPNTDFTATFTAGLV